jgi:bifunctional N-acetylglutamate synthase/kinase
MLQTPDSVSRFLWSIGKRAEGEFYLGLFRSEAKERFAAIAVDGPVMTHALDALVVDLRFLSQLGLVPTVCLGLLDVGDAARHATALVDELARVDVAARLLAPGAGESLAMGARAAIRDGCLPIVPLDATSGRSPTERFETVRALVAEMATRKLIFLQRRGGIALDGQPIGIVELNGDLPGLLASPEVSRKQRTILTGVGYLLERLPHSCTFAITSPLDLLRELFTARGAGTLVRRAAHIERHDDYATLDAQRLAAMLESAFARPLSREFLQRPVSRIYLEEHYRGVAMVTETTLGAYMSKFAVERQAQGEGIGRDVWAALVADYPTVFWRSRAGNPVNDWYTKQCDGMARSEAWLVFWRGLPTTLIPEAIAFALDQPKDFPR